MYLSNLIPFVFLHLSHLLITSRASYLLFGNCLRHSVIRDFNATKYAGDWYEFEKYFSFADYGISCSTVRYDPDPNLNLKHGSVLHYSKRSLSRDSKIVREDGMITASMTNMRRLGNMRGSLNVERQYSIPKDSPSMNGTEIDAYWILDTDYDNYSVVWSCTNYGWMNFQSTTVLTRVRNPTNKIRGLAYGAMKSHGLITKLLFQVGQDDCPADIFTIPDEPPPTTTTPVPPLKKPTRKYKPTRRVKPKTSRPRPKKTTQIKNISAFDNNFLR